MKRKNLFIKGALSSGALILSSPLFAQYSPTPAFTGHIGKTVETTQTAYPQRNPVAKQGSPNVVWILIDDMGFGATSAFGGLIQTPTFDYLANNGLRFNNFHTTSISAPTRSALLTGRNHHSSHVGKFNNDQFGTPGYDTYIPMENGTVAEILRENGYATFAVGKYNATPVLDGSNAGPFNRWPTNRGFDHFYGYNPATAAQDQWHPFIYRDTQREPDDSLGQLAITRFANEAINYIADEKSAAPDKPFFLYLAPGTSHAPYHTTPYWINKYKGKFDAGWDEYAKQVLENEKKLGLVPKDTKLPIANEGVAKWNTLDADTRKFLSHQMEVYAGFVSQADYEIGRIVDFIKEIGQLDNTIFIVALGDNGSAGGGGAIGVKSANTPEKIKAAVKYSLANLDRLGDPTTSPIYASGWAAATSTPFRYYKAWADYEGGTHNGLIVYWPKGITDKGSVRTQYTHVIDVLPTTVELTGAKIPSNINGYKQNPVEGTSFAYAVTSKDNNIQDQKHIQYYELSGNYALYKDGWKVQVSNRNGKLAGTHLYNLVKDFNENADLIKKYPQKAEELLADFDKEAQKYNVYPIRPRGQQDKNYPQQLRPHYDIWIGARSYAEYPYFPGTRRHPYSITSYIESATGKDNGILFSQRNFSFFLKDGILEFATPIKSIKSNRALPQGKSEVKFTVDYDNGKSNVTLYINGTQVAKGQFNAPLALLGGGGTLEFGRQWGLAVNNDYQAPYYFTGKYTKASIDVSL